MAQQQQSSGGGGGDQSMTPVWLVVILFVVAFFVWKIFKVYIISSIFYISIWQAKLVSLFINSPELLSDVYLMQTLDPNAIDWNEFLRLIARIGSYIRYPIAAILLLCAFWLYRSNVILKFKRTHTMKSLRSQEQFNWPAIMPVVKEDLADTDINTGPWAMALAPLEFASKYSLLKKEDALLDAPTSKKVLVASVRKADAKRVFTLQLGPYWEGFDRCPPHAFVLATVFIARIKRDRESAKLILETLDKSFAAGKPNFSIARPILKKYYNSEEVREILGKHAYLLTVMASLLEAARQDGVVPTAEFLWLKLLDRRLWYMLNSVGRQTPYCEAAGPFAHWQAEKAFGRRSLVPMIDEATRALELAVKEIKLSPKVYQELPP